MTAPPDHIKVKRLVHLYLLNIEISEPYHRVISGIFELLNFDDSKDSKEDNTYGNTITKSNHNGRIICILRMGIINPYITFCGEMPWNFLEKLYKEVFKKEKGSERFYDDIKIVDFMFPFILCILAKKGFLVNNVYL